MEAVRGRYGGVYLSKNKNAKKLTERQKQTLEGASDRCKPGTAARYSGNASANLAISHKHQFCTLIF
ncbi:MAG: hypothetical protein ACLR4A_10345 [Christensenellales bacterium]